MGDLDRKRALRLRFRRHLRMQKRQVEELGASAEQRLENDFFKRLERLGRVRRFMTGWVLLVVLLIGCVIAQTRALSTQYQELVPVSGGTYTEGILGAFSNANPLYAIDLVDASVSRLMFAGLLGYDEHNKLVNDMAEDWTVNEAGTLYTVRLKPGLQWHDGQPVTAADVAFTFRVAQNPDAHSPLYSSWQGIKIATTGDRTITFTLPNPLASFPYSLTTGIVPEHLLGKAAMADMRSLAFNTRHPVGSGPFQWQAIELNGASVDSRQEHIALKPYAGYHGGKPKLSSFVIRTFRSDEQLVDSFQKQEVNAIVGLTNIPDELSEDGDMQAYNLPLTAAVMTFFKTTDGVLAEAAVRSALVQASDISKIISSLPYATLPVRSPLLPGQLGYNAAYRQPGSDLTKAQAQLDAAGWVVGKDGIRRKGAQPLSFQLTAQNNGEYPAVARELARQWRAAGADVKVVIPPDDATFQNTLAYHSYDAILHGISIGVDPDVYVYWSSTQADVRAPVRLNLSEYQSKQADAALEAGRTRLDPVLRAEKYKPFLQAWQSDAPALGMYQPRFLYMTRGTVYGLTEHPINTDADRFANVQDWQIRQARKTPK